MREGDELQDSTVAIQDQIDSGERTVTISGRYRVTSSIRIVGRSGITFDFSGAHFYHDHDQPCLYMRDCSNCVFVGGLHTRMDGHVGGSGVQMVGRSSISGPTEVRGGA
jgi:hypothetical protein